MINRILCAIDFSNFPAKVLEHAVEKARKLKVPLTIIFSYRLTEYEKEDNVRNLRSAIETNAREHFADLEKEVLIDQDVPYQFFVEVGFLSDRIESHIRINRNTILIISRKLAESLSELTSDHFFETLKIPVEYVPEVKSEV